MNTLQAHAFEIHKDVLTFIKQNYDLLVKSGLLVPRFRASLNIQKAVDLLRMSYLEERIDPSMMNVCNLLKEFMVRIQRARYETFIINLASAYEGYRFSLPAFLDFRGRIYRSGVLHFHERDLAISLIWVQMMNGRFQNLNWIVNKKFISYDDAHQWYLDLMRVTPISS